MNTPSRKRQAELPFSIGQAARALSKWLGGIMRAENENRFIDRDRLSIYHPWFFYSTRSINDGCARGNIVVVNT